jgi:hypothetical protein
MNPMGNNDPMNPKQEQNAKQPNGNQPMADKGKPPEGNADKVAKNQPADAKGEGDGPAENKPMQQGGSGSNPGFGADKDRERNGSSTPEERGEIGDPNKNFKDKAGDLQLDKFKDKVTKEMLEKYGITEEEWKRYLENVANQKNLPKPEDAKNDTVAGNRSGDSSANRGITKVETRPDARAGDLRSGGPGVAPPEYQDAAAKFSKMLSESKPKK